MKVEQIYTGCLAQGAYYLESNGEAAVIDPLREPEAYIELAESRGAKIKYVFETHFHADFVSGHIDLAAKTGATIVYGPTTMETGYDMYVAKDGEEFKLGNATIRLIHTPGHTMESSCYLLINEEGKEEALFTGDTVFIGDVGRPDLAQKVIADLTQDKLARHLYHSIHNKILPLSDDLIVYPGHGAGSACGKNMSKETSDTLGNQKKNNYALRADMTEEEFVTAVLTGLTPPPGYFPHNVIMNIKGYESIDTVRERALKGLNAEEFKAVSDAEGTVVLDTRSAADFAAGHVPGAVNVGIDGSFASWVGTVIPDVNTPIVLVVDADRLDEVITRLSRVGFDKVNGYLDGGLSVWAGAGYPVAKVEQIDAVQLSELIDKGEEHIVDVRRASEYGSEHVVGVENHPLDYWKEALTALNKDERYYVHCAGGYRSMVFISLLMREGYLNLIDVKGGFSAIKETGKVKVTEYVCPTTLL
jgi:hydroxyacylglutathione hydrolase